MHAFKRALMAFFAATVVMTGIVATPAQAQSHSSQSQKSSSSNDAYACYTVDLPVALPADGSPATVSGKVCANGSPIGKPMLFTVDGLTYTSGFYWDNPSKSYSFARAAALGGFAAFVYDQVGSGGRSTNPYNGVSLLDQADIIHQLITLFKTGKVKITITMNGKAKAYVYVPTKIAAAGHSLGAAELMVYASLHPGQLAGLLLQSYMHTASLAGSTSVAAVRVAATSTSKYADAKWTNYITVAERSIFYNTANAKASTILADPQGVASMATALQASWVRSNPLVTHGITDPVALVVGQEDLLACDVSVGLLCDTSKQLADRGRPNYPNSSCFKAMSIPKGGHSVNLHEDYRVVGFGAQVLWLVTVTQAPGLCKYLPFAS